MKRNTLYTPLSVFSVLPALLAILLLGILTACSQAGSAAPAGASPAAAQTASAAEASPPASPAAAKDKVVVNIGVQGKTGILVYAREKGYFEKAFAAVGAEVKWNEFASGPPHFEALAAGRLDFGGTGGTPVVAGQVGGVDFRAIAVTSDGRKGNMIVIPKTSPIKELKDLKGKKVAVAKGSSAYNFLYLAIDKAGLKGDDVKVIQLQPDEARPALDSGAVDAWSIWEPYATTAVFQAGAKILVSGEDLNINAPGFLIARTKFTHEHPDLTVLFLKTYEEARRYYVAHQDEVANELVQTQKLDKQIITTVLKNADPILSPTTPEFAKAHQEQADFLYKAGAINKQLDTSKVLDNTFVEQALKELGGQP
ncbi:aliphatic sulfonate ABC transporter substrate-binding protein [Paenibacillus athensensis]|uniref:Putative aliphatic sulfonates-binding protein n=1 Tax=Paenibacillus athensensis TaxID=1967502 RepID=A0A4Y8Q4V7_9BACL|nr:aliphatic sulfonate ABC transporter substrate-binding protein [Paenibacillus athensensis]MCD1258362.1 aliphatic sulfonate ABC transporter substrate-binding protein [Paenibacillus athensensis]